jgi:hypothetical protein
MKKTVAYLAATLMVLAMAVATHLTLPAKAQNASCQGQCKQAYNACIKRNVPPAQCKQAFNGCINSCK